MQKRKTALALTCAAACAAAGLATARDARADEAREKELENRVNQLEQKLTEVSENLKGGYFTAGSDLEARVAELEHSMADDKNGLSWRFKAGAKAASGDKAFAYQFYGRLQNDWVWWDAPRDLKTALGDEMRGGTEFRRVRFGANGTLYGNTGFKAEIDFAGGEVEFADVFLELKNCGFGNVTVGHFDEPFGLDRLTSSRFITFMERNLIEQAGFTPGRNTGIMVSNLVADDRLVYQAGMFRDADGAGNDTGNLKAGEYDLTARVAARPVVEDDGNMYLHLGAAASYRDFSDDEVRYRARPHVHIGPRFVDTGTLSGISDGMLLGLEAAFVAGPFTIQGEYAQVDGNGDSGVDDFSFDAFNLQASVWLTGETTQYAKSKGAFDRPKVKKNYGEEGGAGAWQLALAYDTIDLNDGSYAGGEMDTWRFGVNWYLNPHTKVMLNYVVADQNDLSETAKALEMRFQIDW